MGKLEMGCMHTCSIYLGQASSNLVPGSPGLPVELGGATTTVSARARRATSSNDSLVTTLCAVHPFIWENNTAIGLLLTSVFSCQMFLKIMWYILKPIFFHLL